ncbi:SDR family NAD(P)-dependent oxidoreductase [Streptomyces sp. NPDC014733]|uniref:SDR family NAD(P)-dependent oxidoreductase n=1 Tax=Streptomyces sp. NPDC014733 TaxID=3364885 RepID=UPI0036FFE7DB
MGTPQHTIGSGFGARSTADDVLRGIDLSGKLALVTGGYSGLGLAATRALARAGAHVVVPARRRAVAEQAVAGTDGTEVDELDLADQDGIRRFADRFLASGRRLDLILANAGIMACPETRVGPGWEAQFAVNHLGHYALVNHLWPALAPGARVVAVSSAGHQLSPVRWDDVHFTRGYDRWQAYGQAKTANALFATHLDALGRDAGIHAYSLHPGAILTPLQRHLSGPDMISKGWIDAHGTVIHPDFKTPEQGAATSIWAATSPLLAAHGGAYCEDCDLAAPTTSNEGWSGVRDYALDPDQAAHLWTLSAELTGVNAFGRTRV